MLLHTPDTLKIMEEFESQPANWLKNIYSQRFQRSRSFTPFILLETMFLKFNFINKSYIPQQQQHNLFRLETDMPDR
jgi:hypothetical protein